MVNHIPDKRRVNYIVLSIPVFFLLIGVELLVSKMKDSSLYRFNDAVSNISCGIMQQIVSSLAKTALIIGYLWLYDHYMIFDMPDKWWVYVLLFIGVDFFYYWFHRMSHEINLLWGAHIVHHQSEEYNLSVALRQSSLQGFFSTVFYLPLAILGFNPIAFVTINAFQTLYQFWIHTRTINKLHPAVEFIFNTPSHHRVHHGRNPKYIDKNHGGTLIIFDRMFGTFQKEEEEVVYGVTKPLNSWNPVWANVDYYADMWRDLKGDMTWGERLKYIFALPGWRPASLGGALEPPPVDPDHVAKYDTDIPLAVNYYVLAQYVVVLLGTTLLLFNIESDFMTRGLLLGGSVWIIWSVGNLGAIFEMRRWVRYSEPLRWVVMGASAFVIGAPMWIADIIAGVAILSLVSWTILVVRELK